MRLHLHAAIAACVMVVAASVAAKPAVEFGGYLDSDVWTNFRGDFFSNDELDLWMDVVFSEKVSASVCATIFNGSVPARYGLPGGSSTTRHIVGVDTLFLDTIDITEHYSRWVSVLFDGVSLSYASPFGTFTVGDLVYQYGGFSYYFYKRLSMITPENFTRGIQYTLGGDKVSQDILIGSADADHYGDIVGATSIALGENASLGVYYGLRGSVVESFESVGEAFVGTELSGSLGEMLELKLDVGYRNVPKEGDTAVTRANTFALLVEPALTFGDFSTAFSVYTFIDPDTTGTNPVGDEFYAYVEPGYAFTDHFAVGLPLEIHAGDTEDFTGTGSFWVVPTFYVYPTDGVEWWLWGQAVAYLDGTTERDLALGSEIIVEF
jgi:hypothetical protein